MKDLNQRKRQRRIWRVVIVEIIFMALGVICVLLPLEWRLAALIALGARGIIVKAYAQLKQPIEPMTENTANGKEKRKDNNRGENRGKQERKRGKAQNAESKKGGANRAVKSSRKSD